MPLKVAPNVNFVQTRISSLSAGVEPDIERDYCTYNYKIPGSAETWLKCLKYNRFNGRFKTLMLGQVSQYFFFKNFLILIFF